MNISVKGYMSSGAIAATLDGVDFTVPDNMSNRHRFRIWDEWEMGTPDPVTGERQRVRTIPPFARAVTVDDVVAERERRLALGFDHNFGDQRGVHHIATSEQDLKNWDEVTKLASAYLAAGRADATIAIKTDTAAITVTASEWQLVLISAGFARQPLFQGSFVLQEMDPIPHDYTDDRHWS